MSDTIKIVMGPSGLQPFTPAAIKSALLYDVAATNPGYTANLPGILIEDVSSTDTAAILACNSALVDLVNSVTPYGANQFILNQLAAIYGVQQGASTNTSVFVTFTGTVGFVISKGFVVGDGTHQYTVQDGGIIPTGGTTLQLYCLATQPGTWAVPANTVTQLGTSVPGGIALTCRNPLAGTPSIGAEPVVNFRAGVLQAGLAASMGTPRYMKTLLRNVPGVQSRLVSVVQKASQWEVIVGGGDPYLVGNAIFNSLFDITSLVGSKISVLSVTKTNPAVVTTDLNHGFVTGNTVVISGATEMPGINGTWVATVISGQSFSVPYNASAAPAYTGNGVVTPNARNVVATINNYPNTYNIAIVVPPVQSVSVSLTWNTTSLNSVSSVAMAVLGSSAIVTYINSISVGQPLNLFELQNAFQIATTSILPTALLTRMAFNVYINGTLTVPAAGTGVISGDPESYFLTDVTLISITRG